MIKIEKIETWGFEHAIRGMRNPMNSWDKGDSYYTEYIGFYSEHLDAGKQFKVGKGDLNLMRGLCQSGHPHRKYLRQIMVSMDITAPLYWWKEFDTYKVGVTRNSCSTMHKIHSKEFELDDFSHEQLTAYSEDCLLKTIAVLNIYRQDFLKDKSDKRMWWQMIQLLPSSYNQKATITCNYENIVNMLEYRSEHKLDEWRAFCETMVSELPYLKEIIND